MRDWLRVLAPWLFAAGAALIAYGTGADDLGAILVAGLSFVAYFTGIEEGRLDERGRHPL
jgi:hypothetical protein